MILDQLDLAAEALGDALRLTARIDTDAMIVPRLTQEHQEVSLAAPDFQNRLVSQAVALDPAIGQCLRELVERRREGLRLFAVGVVVLNRSVVDTVADECARAAKRQPKMPAGIAACFLGAAHQQGAMT